MVMGGERDGGEVWEDVFEGGGLVERHYFDCWWICIRRWEDREKGESRIEEIN